ncbi:alternative ribosome rescue aminoacyl-tRNA hydrolase ArfB [Draconibacterium sp.]|nr:alternative ribosome rescue aminoacyl-tRNA hydrolase ArfB [Draconibacterium sp.]
MHICEERRKQIKGELKFSASRSSGPGGQHVNKVNTRVELRFSLFATKIFSKEEKQIIQNKLKNRINAEGEIILVSSVERSQWRNKEKVIEKFFGLIEKALTPVKKRIKTKPTKSSRLKRLEGKKLQSQKKQMRKAPEL